MRIRARHYASGEPVDITCEGARIRSVQSPSSLPPDHSGEWVAPAFFDIQVNGCGGKSFHSLELTIDDVEEIAAACRRHGTLSFCPTVLTDCFEAMAHGLRTIHEACESDSELAATIPTIHLEGPYLSAEEGPRGAHPWMHVRPPDWNEFCRLQEAAGGLIRLVTLAPELEGAIPFIEKLADQNIVVAIGHTAAGGACIADAVRAGARLSTHLGNGAHLLLPRQANYIWEQLAEDRLWASLICDGEHLTPAVARCIVRMKTPEHSILISDVSSLAGLPAGRYAEWNQQFDVLANGRIVIAESDYLAGSASFLDGCIGNAVRDAGLTMAEAIDMAGARPAELLGLSVRHLQRGDPADLVLFDWDGELRVTATIQSGQWESYQ